VRVLPLLVASRVIAQPVAHEYVPDPGGDVPRPAIEEDELRVGDQVILPPAGGSPRAGEPVLEEAPPGGVQPDRETAAEDTLRYWEPFNPSTAPFKRTWVLDAVGEDYLLLAKDTALRPVPVGGSPLAGRDPFWASYLVRFAGGRPVPVPSVAADLRVLSLSADPPGPVDVLRDGTDTIFLRSRMDGPRRVTMLVDAPASYFAPRILPDRTANDLPAEMRPTLPRTAKQAARGVLSRIGVRADDPLDQALERLVGHFRSFSAGPLDRTSGDVYLDLALGGRGACRHRAFAFVVTAQALGIPARYVQNEAHAFAEIWLPGSGWGRVDLGGVALSLDIDGAQDKTMYQAGPDPFPQPAPFARGYSRLAGAVHGLPQGATAPRALRPDEAPLPDPLAPPGLRLRVRVTMQMHSTTGVRGDTVLALGRLLDDAGRGVPDLRVGVYLSPDGAQRGLRLGEAVSDADGRWRLEALVPVDAPVGRYQLIAATQGDARHAAARSP